MNNKMTVLQLCPLSAYLEGELSERFDCVHWFKLADDEKSVWLSNHAAQVRGIATGGHLGCSNDLADQLPNLGLIAINGVGFDKVDLAYAKARGIAVTTTPGVLTEDVADLAIGLIISALRRLPSADKFIREGKWQQGDVPLARKVTGTRFGIVGLGQIGSAIAHRLAPFGSVAYTNLAPCDVPYEFFGDAVQLAQAVDVLIIACSATPDNVGLIGEAVFTALGEQGYLVNVSRGSLVDESALIRALESGTIGGAALDVFIDEPNVPAALINSEKTVLTPHIASATVETRTAMADYVLNNLSAFAENKPLFSPLAL